MLTVTRVHDPSALLPQVAEVYRSAFSIFKDAPREAEVARFALDTLPSHALRDTFRFVAALEDDVLLGFIYGFQGHSGDWWEDWLRLRLPPALYDRWFDAQFDLTEFCVRADRHGEGIGSRLYDVLMSELAGTAHERAVLTTRRVDNPARAFYLRRGWEIVWDALDDRFSLFGLRLG